MAPPPEDDRIREAYCDLVSRESVLIFLSRIIPFTVVFGALVFGTALTEAVQSREFGVGWLCVVGIELVLIYTLWRQRTYRGCCGWALACVLCTSCWWLLLPYFEVGNDYLLTILLSVFVIGAGSLPWPAHCNLALASCLLLTVPLVRVPHFPIWVIGIIFAILVTIVIRFAAHSRLSYLTQISLSFLARYCESSSVAALTTLRLVLTQLMWVADEPRAFAIFGNQSAEYFTGQRKMVANVDSLYLRAFQQVIDDTGLEQGVVKVTQLGPQLQDLLREWFGRIPVNLYFVRFTTVVDNVEQRVAAFLPLSVGARLAGIYKTVFSLSSLSAVARISLAAARSRFISSDVLLMTQQSVSEREDELNQLVHLVNNVAQDMSIQCEQLRNQLTPLIESAPNSPDYAPLIDQFEQLESLARALAMGVSDVKLLKEMANVRNFSRQEEVPVKEVLDELQLYALSRAKRSGYHFAMHNEVPPEVEVQVISRDFLETALRTLVREFAPSSGASGNAEALELRSRVTSNVGVVNFELFGTGPIAAIELAEQVQNTATRTFVPDKHVTVLRAIANFVTLSGGTFAIEPTPTSSHAVRVLISLSVTLRQETARIRGEQWALFVDDNPQVTTFYGRVAQALSMKFATATSVAEAQALLGRQGKPHLVITDVQLKEGSGLELVRLVREHYGNTFPILVVSGNPEEDLKQKVIALGATKFLAKPVSRARLFGEIERVLNL